MELKQVERQPQARRINIAAKSGIFNLAHELTGGNNPPCVIHHPDQTFMEGDTVKATLKGKYFARLPAIDTRD